MSREAKLLYMQDLVEHLGRCCEQWQHADRASTPYLAATMQRDLQEFQRLCTALAEEGQTAPGLETAAPYAVEDYAH